jgi:uncharacterized membrane protein YkvI
MRQRYLRIFLFIVVFATAFTGYAWADVAAGPTIAAFIGIPVIAAAVIIIAAVLIIKTIKNTRGKK